MKSRLAFIFLFLLTGNCFSQFTVSTNGRYLMRGDKPFFWLGDTAWELFHRLNREDADYYLKRRAEQGFTVIQAVILSNLDGLHKPNAYGEVPLKNDDPTKPGEEYFRHVDYIIDQADKYGLVIGLLPSWGDKVLKLWREGPEIFNPENARIYGKWLGNRYKERKNIIWILGGDRNPQTPVHEEIWRKMAEGITESVGGNDKAIITFHPQHNMLGSAQWFHNDKWLDFNMFQNGHCRDFAVYENIRRAYNLKPAKPVMDAEPLYEDHIICHNTDDDLGYSSPYDMRKFAYLDLFSGAHGHTYGCHDVWQFYTEEIKQIYVRNPDINWKKAMELPGARHMKYVRMLMESRPLLDRVPDQSLIVENNSPAAERIQATRGKDYLFVYSAAGRAFTVNLGKISGEFLQGFWYNPKNGESKPIEPFQNIGSHKFTPPQETFPSRSGYGNDWVLILDDADKDYKAPVS